VHLITHYVLLERGIVNILENTLQNIIMQGVHTMNKYEKVVLTYIVKPVGESIYSELATEITIDDEGSGPYVKISQSPEIVNNAVVLITKEEWPLIAQAVDQLIEKWCKEEKEDKFLGPNHPDRIVELENE
jgi:hypothetical protein